MADMTQLYVWIMRRAEGDRIVVCQTDAKDLASPMLAQTEREAQVMRPVIEQIQEQEGYPVKLVRFLRCDVLETIG